MYPTDYNLALIVLHRRSFTKSDFGVPKEVTGHSRSICTKAAIAIILHVHGLFQAAPNLRRWKYYCFYCLQATLVLLVTLVDEPLAEETQALIMPCKLSVTIFKQFDLKAGRRCADMVARVLEGWHRHRDSGRNDTGKLGGGPTDGCYTSMSPVQSQQSPRTVGPTTVQPGFLNRSPSQHAITDMGPESALDLTDLDFQVDNDVWDYFMSSEMHSRPFESWMKLLNEKDFQS